MLLLSARDVRRAIDAATLIDAIDASLREGSSGWAHVPPRIKLSLGDTNDDRLIVMPAYLSQSHVLATKIVTTFPRNPARGLPHIIGLVVLHDADTGAPLAIIDGATVTELRTAAASVVATRALVGRAPRVLALIGAGAQARAHLELLAGVYDFADVRVCAAHSGSAERLVRDAAPSLPGQIRALADAESAVRGAALVVTATTAVEPVLHGAWLDPGTHVCAVGSARLTHREIDSDVVARAAVIAVDERDAALTEAGDLVTPLKEGRIAREQVVEVGEILLGRAQGRRGVGDITLYKGVGSAAMDAAAAAAIFRGAVSAGVGSEFSFAER